MTLQPMKFHPILKAKVWGGRKLEEYGKQLPPVGTIGESWELADLPVSIPDGRSVIDGGALDGRTLQDVIEHDAEALLGKIPRSPEGGFPLLLKYLDANENLSVQVHPDARYVREHPNTHLKSEAWHILDAIPGSVIYAGLKPGVDERSFTMAIQDGTVVEQLEAIPAIPGECHYLPSGTCHALGAGVLVAEIQTPSDTTFRVWDWGRTSRELHVEEAMKCIDFSNRKIRQDPPASIRSDGCIRTTLVDVEHFKIERLQIEAERSVTCTQSDAPLAIMVVAGSGTLVHRDDVLAVNAGNTLLLPASSGTCRLEALINMEVLAVSLQAV